MTKHRTPAELGDELVNDADQLLHLLTRLVDKFHQLEDDVAELVKLDQAATPAGTVEEADARSNAILTASRVHDLYDRLDRLAVLACNGLHGVPTVLYAR